MENENPEFLQINLRRLIDGNGWSYKRFAIESGVSYHTVFRTITEGRVPRGENLQKMAKALGVSISKLWEEPSTAKPIGEPVEDDTKKILEILEKRLPDRLPELEAALAENEMLKATIAKLEKQMNQSQTKLSRGKELLAKAQSKMLPPAGIKRK